MKKILIIAVLFLGGALSKATAQAVHMSNFASCSITIRMNAHDGTSTSCGSYFSQDIVIAGGGGSATIAGFAALNNPTCTPVCWAVSPGGPIDPPTAVWDFALVWETGVGCILPIGPATTCATSVSSSGSLSPCCSASGSWTTFMGDVYIAFQ